MAVLCPFREVTGWNCPLCGGTRATFAMLSGHLPTALRDNALVVLVVLPMAIWVAVRWLGPRVGARWTAREWRWERRWVVALAVLALVFTVVRNLPGAPFSSLRPA